MSTNKTMPVAIPTTHLTKTYAINTTELGANVTKVSIAPSITNNVDCKETDSKNIGSK